MDEGVTTTPAYIVSSPGISKPSNDGASPDKTAAEPLTPLASNQAR